MLCDLMMVLCDELLFQFVLEQIGSTLLSVSLTLCRAQGFSLSQADEQCESLSFKRPDKLYKPNPFHLSRKLINFSYWLYSR